LGALAWASAPAGGVGRGLPHGEKSPALATHRAGGAEAPGPNRAGSGGPAKRPQAWRFSCAAVKPRTGSSLGLLTHHAAAGPLASTPAVIGSQNMLEPVGLPSRSVGHQQGWHAPVAQRHVRELFAGGKLGRR